MDAHRKKMILRITRLRLALFVGLGACVTAGALTQGSPADNVASTNISPSQATAIALSVADSAGDQAITKVQSVTTTIGEGVTTIGPGAELSTTSAISQWAAEPAYVEVMQGQFSLAQVPRPKNAAMPTGSVLSLVINADTGAVAFTALNDSTHGPTSSELENLGALETVDTPQG